MWTNTLENEYDSGTGCAWKSACNGTATWVYYDETQWVQYFCNEEQTLAAADPDLKPPFEGIWTMADEKKVTDGFKDVCKTNDDCEGDMLCRDYFYDLDHILTSWDRGKICVGNWIYKYCEDDRKEFMLLNVNYNISQFDYTYSQRCIEYVSSTSGAQAIAGAVMATLAANLLLN